MNYIRHCNYVPFWKREDPTSKIIDNTWAMYWIQHVKKDVPEYLRHDPEIQCQCELTCAMLWLMYVRTDIPVYLRHDPKIQCYIGWTCTSYWIYYVSGNVPKYLK